MGTSKKQKANGSASVQPQMTGAVGMACADLKMFKKQCIWLKSSLSYAGDNIKYIYNKLQQSDPIK